MGSVDVIPPSGSVRELFFQKSDECRGRRCMLLSSIFSSIISGLTGGIFYSGFLTGHGINIVNIGILTFIPSIASFLGLLSPLLLERFAKRKWILTCGRLAYYIINILGTTLLAEFVADPIWKMVGFVCIVFTASCINFLFNPGYTVWQVNFLPEHIRADYFGFSTMCIGFLSGIVLITSSAIADSLAGSPKQMLIITILRYLALAIGLLDAFVLSRPREYPYKKTENPGLKDTFFTPIKNRKFMLTLLIACGYHMIGSILSPVLDTWLLNDVGVSYTFIIALNVSYSFFFLLLRRPAARIVRKYSWFKVFMVVLLIHAPTYFLYAFVTNSNYLWLVLIVRLTQHLCFVFLGIISSNFMYINLPEENRTACVSFYTFTLNIAMLLAMTFGTFYVKQVGEKTLHLFGRTLTGVPQLMLIVFLIELVEIALVGFLTPLVSPKKE